MILDEIPPQITNLIPWARTKFGFCFFNKFKRLISVLMSPIKLKPCLFKYIDSYLIPNFFMCIIEFESSADDDAITS